MLFLHYNFIDMKKILGLLLVALFFVSCDDGDLSVTNAIRYDASTLVKCNLNNILYKLNGDQALILEITNATDFAKIFKNEEKTKDILNIDLTTNKLLFRTYNGEVKTTNICATTTDAFPTAKEEWVAQSGKIEVKTTAIISTPNTTTNATRITGYNHAIILKDIEWLKPDGKIQLENLERPFGVFQTAPTYPLAFGFQDNPLVFKSTCPNDNTIVAKSGSEAMRLKLDDTSYAALFTTATTLPNEPKSKPLTATNTVTYNLYNNIIAISDFCLPFPATRPVMLEEWKADLLTGTTTATIEVETATETTTTVKHTIYLKGITFSNGNVTFYYGDRIKFGYFLAPN
jgi:hypothetical protein